MSQQLRALAAVAALAGLSGGYSHGRRIEMATEDDQPPERYMAADFGSKPAVTFQPEDVQRIADAQAKRARKAAKRLKEQTP